MILWNFSMFLNTPFLDFCNGSIVVHKHFYRFSLHIMTRINLHQCEKPKSLLSLPIAQICINGMLFSFNSWYWGWSLSHCRYNIFWLLNKKNCISDMDHCKNFLMTWKIQPQRIFKVNLTTEDAPNRFAPCSSDSSDIKYSPVNKYLFMQNFERTTYEKSCICGTILQPILPSQFCIKTGHCVKGSSTFPWFLSRSPAEPFYQ